MDPTPVQELHEERCPDETVDPDEVRVVARCSLQVHTQLRSSTDPGAPPKTSSSPAAAR